MISILSRFPCIVRSIQWHELPLNIWRSASFVCSEKYMTSLKVSSHIHNCWYVHLIFKLKRHRLLQPWVDCISWLDLHDLRALLGFERWQSAKKGLSLGSVKDHLGSIDGVEASRVEVVLDWISPSSFEAASWSFPTMDVRVEVKDSSYRERGWHAMEMSEPA